MDAATVDALLSERLAARNAWQTDCFEELALVFACQLELAHAAQGPPANAIDVERERAGTVPSDAAGEAGGAAPAKMSSASGGGGGAPVAGLDLRREVLRLRNQLDVLKAGQAERDKSLALERGARARAEASVAELRVALDTLREEHKTLRAQHERLDELYVDVRARNHEMEGRMVAEKLKMAETLNKMNEMVSQQAPRWSEAQAQSSPGGPGEMIEAPPSAAGSATGPAAAVQVGRFRRGLRGVDAIPPAGGGRGSGAGSGAMETWVCNIGVGVPTSWKVLSEATGHKVSSICYNDDGTRLISGSSDGTVQLWSPLQRSKIHGGTASTKHPVLSVDTKGRTVLGTSDRVCYLWMLDELGNKLRPVHQLTGHASSVVAGKLSPDARIAATGGRRVKVWDVATGGCTRTIDAFSKCLALDVNEQCTLLVTGHADKGLRLWDLRTCKQVSTLPGLHSAPITSATFSCAGTQVLTSSMDHSLAMVPTNAQTVEEASFFRHQEYRANAWWSKACLSPIEDSHASLLLANGSKDGGLHIWRAASGEAIFQQKAHSEAITCTAWSPRGSQLATCDNEGVVMVWNMAETRAQGEAAA